MPITPDGYFLAYKKVRPDFTSFHDCNTRNDVGSSVFMPREQCEFNRVVCHSGGLHFCSFSYLPMYSGHEGHVLVLKVNPADVVSIPIDADDSKGRACRYTVVDTVPEDEVAFAFPQPIYTTGYEEEEFEEHFEAPPVGILGRLRAWFGR